MASILFSKNKGVATLTLNRPKSYNSFNREMAFLLQDELQKCQEDQTIRAVVLTGEGKAFCAGQDLGEVTDPDQNPGFKKILEEHYNPIIQQIRYLEKPVIAAVNGVAAGAGANLALACDIVIARESAKFIQAFSAIGLVPDSGGTFILPRLIGFQKAMALAMLGDHILAPEAEQMGMIYKAIKEGEFEEFVEKIAHKLANMPTKGLSLTKKLFNESVRNNLEQQLKMESKYQIEASQTEDYQEGVTAFLEKRKPKFKGY